MTRLPRAFALWLAIIALFALRLLTGLLALVLNTPAGWAIDAADWCGERIDELRVSL